MSSEKRAPDKEAHHKLTAARRAILVEASRLGLSRDKSAQKALVSRASLFNWLAKGRADRDSGAVPWPWDDAKQAWAKASRAPENASVELDLLDAMEAAESERLADALKCIQDAIRGGSEIEETVTESDGTKTTKVTKRTKRLHPSWQAAAWMLEHTAQKDYAIKQDEVTLKPQGTVAVTFVTEQPKSAEDAPTFIGAPVNQGSK